MDYLAYLIYRIFSEGIALLPLPVGFTLGRILGTIAYYVAVPYRRLVLRNLGIAFEGEKSPAEIRRLAKEHFGLLGANLVSACKLATMSTEEIGARVSVENIVALQKASRTGRGIIAVIAHLGNWELLAQIIPQALSYGRAGTIYQPLGNKYFDRHVNALRSRFGLVPFNRRRGFAEPIKFLREGGLVSLLIDQHAGDGGVWTPFFGRLASTSPLAATMGIRTGAPIIAVAVYTAGCARWRIVFTEPLVRETHDPDRLTAELNLELEKEIRVSPADWFWVHARWKTPRPEFLLVGYKRGVALPANFAEADLKPIRILIRSPNWLGDAVMSAPAVRAIKAGRPDAHVTILTPAKLADFWKTMPEVDGVLAIEPGEGLFSVARKISRRFDVAFVFPNSVRTGLEAWLAGIPRRIGYRRPWRGRMINAIITDPKPGPARHQVHHYLAMARYAGAEITPDFVYPPVSQGERLYLGLAPGAEYGAAKRWMPESFAAVARRLREEAGVKWRIFGVEADRPIADLIATRLDGQCENLAGKTTLAELIERLRECRLLLTNDTGTMHLAAHLGVPLVAVFGSTEDELTGPLGQGSRVVRHHVVCSPCFLRECPLDFRCMQLVTVEEVTEAVIQVLSGAAPTL